VLRRAALQIGENFSEGELRAMMKWADQDQDGVLDEDEFISALTPAKWGMGPEEGEEGGEGAKEVLNFK
jgi:hypothetical protein